MKKLYYFIATIMVIGVISFFETNRTEASSVIDELQRSNLEVLSSESYYLDTRCFRLYDTKDPRDIMFHKCGDITTYGQTCYIGYTTLTQRPTVYIKCFLMPKD